MTLLSRGIAAAFGAALVAALAASPASAAGRVGLTFRAGALDRAPGRVAEGRTTFAVRNAGPTALTFLVARHAGGLDTLPRLEGVPFVAPETIVARLDGIRPRAQRVVSTPLRDGEYLLVATTNAPFVTAASRLLVGARFPVFERRPGIPPPRHVSLGQPSGSNAYTLGEPRLWPPPWLCVTPDAPCGADPVHLPSPTARCRTVHRVIAWPSRLRCGAIPIV